MDTKKLAREYGSLSATERFTLGVAAAARGDEVELTRLRAAARPIARTVTDQFGHTMAFTDVAEEHWAARLHLATLMFKLRHLADTTGPHQEKSRAAARLAAYMLGVYADGWALFCRRAGLDPAGAGGWKWEDTVLQAEAEATELGVTDDEIVELAEQTHVWDLLSAEAQFKTRESVATDIRLVHLNRLVRWGVD